MSKCKLLRCDICKDVIRDKRYEGLCVHCNEDRRNVANNLRKGLTPHGNFKEKEVGNYANR